MAVVSWPADDPPGPVVACAICKRPVGLADATAGRRYANGGQAFACDRHLSEAEMAKLVLGWVDFTIKQVYVYGDYSGGADSDAWSLR